MSYPLVLLNMPHSCALLSQKYTCSDDNIYELLQRMRPIILTVNQCQEEASCTGDRTSQSFTLTQHYSSHKKDVNYQVLAYLGRGDQSNDNFLFATLKPSSKCFYV